MLDAEWMSEGRAEARPAEGAAAPGARGREAGRIGGFDGWPARGERADAPSEAAAREAAAERRARREERDARRARAREMFSSRFQMEAAFVNVPRLAKALGLAPSTIHGYIRAGVFFIPWRMVGDSPMVSVEDLAAWYCDGASTEPVSRREPRPEPKPEPEPPEGPLKSAREVADETLAAMGIKPGARRAARAKAAR